MLEKMVFKNNGSWWIYNIYHKEIEILYSHVQSGNRMNEKLILKVCQFELDFDGKLLKIWSPILLRHHDIEFINDCTFKLGYKMVYTKGSLTRRSLPLWIRGQCVCPHDISNANVSLSILPSCRLCFTNFLFAFSNII